MQLPKLDILFEDNHLLAVNKPAGLPTQGVASDADSLVRAAKAFLKQRHDKPGNVYLGVVSRLDAVVSGVVLLARTSKAAARLAEQFRGRTVEKTYWAVAAGMPAKGDELVDWVAKDERAQRMAVVAQSVAGAQKAMLEYRVLRPVERGALLEIRLITGRKHQIRLQLSTHGHPVLGDRKYGSAQRFSPGIALHARRLVVDHPTRHEPIEIVAPLPASWQRWGLGG
ncbi:MAG TPA: RluA family pseudouridine synthase [Pirellulales bacterium]|jgi:23S rRNA pseudouridine1911/1915/1917 synthase|nr:RluA family pseudouridine synthase [Pirellulales bacterium]